MVDEDEYTDDEFAELEEAEREAAIQIENSDTLVALLNETMAEVTGFRLDENRNRLAGVLFNDMLKVRSVTIGEARHLVTLIILFACENEPLSQDFLNEAVMFTETMLKAARSQQKQFRPLYENVLLFTEGSRHVMSNLDALVPNLEILQTNLAIWRRSLKQAESGENSRGPKLSNPNAFKKSFELFDYFSKFFEGHRTEVSVLDKIAIFGPRSMQPDGAKVPANPPYLVTNLAVIVCRQRIPYRAILSWYQKYKKSKSTDTPKY